MTTPTRETLAARLRRYADDLDGCIITARKGNPVLVETVPMLRQAADALDATCEWTLDDTYGNKWDTSCSEAYEFLTDGPVENKQAFCGYCGKRLVVVPPAPSTGPRD